MRYCWRSWLATSVSTASAWGSCRRDRVVSDRTVLPPIWCCLWFVGYRIWRRRNVFRCMYRMLLSTLPKRTTPLTEPSSGHYSPVVMCHIIWNRPFVISTMACEHVCDSTTGVPEVFRCGTGPSSRLRARAPSVQHLLRGCYKRGIHAFQGGQRHYGRSGAPEEENWGGRQGGTNTGEYKHRRVNPGDVRLGRALHWRCRSRLSFTQEAEEDDGHGRGRMRVV